MKKEFIFRLVLALGIFFLVYQFGLRPIFMNTSQKSTDADNDLSRGLPAGNRTGYDLVVLGAEPDGIAAAVSAARLGARTLLLAEGNDFGGTVSRCMLSDLEILGGAKNKMLNEGILSEFYQKLGNDFSAQKYISAAKNMVDSEKYIDVKYDAVLDSPILEDGRLTGLNVTTGGIETIFSGRFFMDATRDGVLLAACKVPYITGSEDLNMKDSYIPAMLNFEMEGSQASAIKNLLSEKKDEFVKGLGEYRPLNVNIRLNNFKVFYPEADRIIIQGLEMANLDVADKKQMDSSYGIAAKEAENLAVFLSNRFTQFGKYKYLKAADSFYLRENRHFTGAYILSVNDILENTYFDDTIAMGSYPVQAGKFADGGVYPAGKPVQYGIPLGCLIPGNIGNLLMTGSKISCSSLAASSAGTIGTGIAEGEAAGITAVYSLLRGVSPSEIAGDRDMKQELESFLGKQKMYLPKLQIKNTNAVNWSYPAVRQLLKLGLVAGGLDNNLGFDKAAKQKDLATILLNGIYRLNKDSYSLEFDARLRPYIRDDSLTGEGAAEMLLAMYGQSEPGRDAYKRSCDQGYINDIMQLRLKGKKILTLDDVYYLGAYNIKLFTGKDI